MMAAAHKPRDPERRDDQNNDDYREGRRPSHRESPNSLVEAGALPPGGVPVPQRCAITRFGAGFVDLVPSPEGVGEFES